MASTWAKHATAVSDQREMMLISSARVIGRALQVPELTSSGVSNTMPIDAALVPASALEIEPVRDCQMNAERRQSSSAVRAAAARSICGVFHAGQMRPSVCSIITLLERKKVTPTQRSINTLAARHGRWRTPMIRGWLSTNQSNEATHGRMQPLITLGETSWVEDWGSQRQERTQGSRGSIIDYLGRSDD